MTYIPVAPNAAGGSAVDPLAELQRLMDPSCVSPEQSHYLMKLLLARLPQNRKEELSVHLFPKALDLMTQNNLWGKLLPFVPCWFKYRAHFVGSRHGAPSQSIPKQQSAAIPPPASASVKSAPNRDLAAFDWTAAPSEPLPENKLLITPPPTPTNVGEPILTLPTQPLAFEDPLSNPYRMCDPVQSFYLLKLLLARLPIFERSKVANPLLVLAIGFMHQNRLWHELSPFNPTWSKLELSPVELKAIQTSDLKCNDPHLEDPLSNVTLCEFNNEQTFYLLKLLLARLPTYLRPMVSPILLKKGMQVLLENGLEKHLAPFDPNFSKKSIIDSGNISLGSTTHESSTVVTTESKQTLVTNMVKTLPQQTQQDIVLPQDNLQDVSLTTHVNTDENRSTPSPPNEAVAVSPPKEENVFRPIEPAQPTPSVQPNADKDGGRRAQSAGYSDERDNRGTSQERGRGRGGYGDRTRPGSYNGRGNFGRGGNGRSGRFSPGGHYYDFSGNDKPEFDWTVSSLDSIKSYEDQYCMKMIRGELPEPEDDGEPIIRRINKKNVVFQVKPTSMNLKKDAQVTVPPSASSALPFPTTHTVLEIVSKNIPSTAGASTDHRIDPVPSDFNWSAPVDAATTVATTVPEPIPNEPEQAPQQNGSFVDNKVPATSPVVSQPSTSAALPVPHITYTLKRGPHRRNPDGSFPIDIMMYTKRDMMKMLRDTCMAPSTHPTPSASNLPPTSPVKEDLSTVDWSAPSPTAPATPVASTSTAASSPQSQQSNQSFRNDQPRNRNQSSSSRNERPRQQQQPLSPYSVDGPPSAEALNWKPPHAVQQQRAPSNDRKPTANNSGNANVSTSPAASTAVVNGTTDWSAPPPPVADASTDWSAPPATPPPPVDSAEASGKLRSSFKIAPDCASPVYASELSDTSSIKSGTVIYYSAQPKPQVIPKPKSDGHGDNSVPSQESVQQVALNKDQDWCAPPAKDVSQKVNDWAAASPAGGDNFAAPPAPVAANTDWSAPPPASEMTDWSAAPIANDVRPPVPNVPVAVDDWSAPPAPTIPVVPEARQPQQAKPTEPIPQDFDWSTNIEESVVSTPAVVASQPVTPVQARPSDYSPSKPNYNNDNRNDYVEQKRQPPPPPPQEVPATTTDFSNFDWSAPATPPPTPVGGNSPKVVPSRGPTPNYDQRTPQQADHDRSRSASNNAVSEDSRRGGRGGFRGRGGYNNGYTNGGDSNDNRPQQNSNDGGYNPRGTGGWSNGYSGDTPRGGGYRGGTRGGGGYNSYNGNTGGYGSNEPQQSQQLNSQATNGDWSSAPTKPAPPAAAQPSPAPVAASDSKLMNPQGMPQSLPQGTQFDGPPPKQDFGDFDWASPVA